MMVFRFSPLEIQSSFHHMRFFVYWALPADERPKAGRPSLEIRRSPLGLRVRASELLANNPETNELDPEVANTLVLLARASPDGPRLHALDGERVGNSPSAQ